MKYIKMVTREYSVQYTDAILHSLADDLKKYLPALIHHQFFVPEGKNEACYFAQKEFSHYLKALENNYFNNRQLQVFIKNFNNFGKKYELFGKQFNSKKLAKLNNENLINYYCEYFDLLIIYIGLLWTAYFINDLYSEWANKLLAKHNIADNQKLITALLSPVKRTGILLLQDEINKLKNRGTLIKKDFDNLLRKYSWLSCLDLHNDPWQKTDLQKMIANTKEPQEAYTFSKALKLVNLNEDEKRLLKNFREVIYIKDLRDEYRRKGIFNIIPFFNEISKRLGLSRKQLAYFTKAELVNALKNKSKLDFLAAEKRTKGFLIYCKNKKVYLTTDKTEIEKFKINNSIISEGDEDVEIKGLVACKGKHSGAVKIVLGIKDISKIMRGDILVANTTHPDYVQAMALAGAIITDEGGLTSHAAIVSRELGTPCIVGTKIATKVFKDGDLVEVDAVKGIIKKI